MGSRVALPGSRGRVFGEGYMGPVGTGKGWNCEGDAGWIRKMWLSCRARGVPGRESEETAEP